ncbi:hypothetical protein SNE25_21505 [Mucilaginibacter sabulilitoris]|uniref:Ig-like domain-containing protein n=1 Tax=Mucilaginibacter sabulilitoris TaxID=1173583 RepID=A0ABZ0THM3_9SPHI|nr:hypothetical protein [Mucilaginibacter sabulilitoris]WPU91897.1 hypothetical protein SNE25_21505 [Mucilaginibacter sabulilitoris]
MIPEPIIFVLPFPQFLQIGETAVLSCNVLLTPKFSPLEPLAVDGGTTFDPFASAKLQMNAWLVKGGTEVVPNLDRNNGEYTLKNNLISLTTDRSELFTKVGSFFTIDDAKKRTLSITQINKYLPEAYRNSFDFNNPRTANAKTDDSYFCALKQTNSAPANIVPDHTVNWAQVYGFCLQQPLMAEKLGLLHRQINLDAIPADFFKEGGWIYFEFSAQDSTTSYDKLNSSQVQLYAARIPAITESRHLFAPVLFPVVADLAPTQPFDEAFRDLIRYDDGYAKIVHASQSVSINNLVEAPDGNPPVTDQGIRLGWDDEQILIWYNNSINAKRNPADPPSSILSLSRYRIDVAKANDIDKKDLQENALNWESQVIVHADNLQTAGIDLGEFYEELGLEVSPVKHNGSPDFWLPVFFTNWNGNSLCLPDPVAEEIFLLKEQLDKKAADLEALTGKPALRADGAGIYHQKETDYTVQLKYGNTYAFRVRLTDLTGGGPAASTFSVHPGESKIAWCPFKRHVAPQVPVIKKVDIENITVTRPRLNYPAILYTGQDNSVIINELKADRIRLSDLHKNSITPATPDSPAVVTDPAALKESSREVSLPDPDADTISIIIEVKTLNMDREGSYHALHQIDTKEPYIFLYETTRPFPAYQLDHNSAGDQIDLKFDFQDIPAINFGADANDLGFEGDLTVNNGPLILPSARDVRLTIRTYCKAAAENYFAPGDFRYSLPITLTIRKDPAKLETKPLLLAPVNGNDDMVSIFFRPPQKDTPDLRKAASVSGRQNQTDSDVIERLANETKLVSKALTLMGADNVRTQFGCSRIIGHSLSPDYSSITFASRDDLAHKWINVLQLDLNRDWTWDILQPVAFKIKRQWRFETEADMLELEVGEISLSKGLNWQQMDEPDRSKTRLVFIDALDPKPGGDQLPEPIEVHYQVIPQFKDIFAPDGTPAFEWNEAEVDIIVDNYLPIATNPVQIPEIVSVGIAVTPEDAELQLFENQYSETSYRRKYLWVEFAEPVKDYKDTYFARILQYSADPMLAVMPNIPHPEIEMPEPAINLEPENIRVIRNHQQIDFSGLEAMQQMIPTTDGNLKSRHFLLPLPKGLTPESKELFGFFTYEFRIGHCLKWSMAQARHSRSIRVTGVQHPAPPMQLSIRRENDVILVSSVYAQSYADGKDCTPAMPRTEIYALLYAQVIQADGVQYRNVLIDELPLLKPVYESDEVKREELIKIQMQSYRTFYTNAAPYALAPPEPPVGFSFWRMNKIRNKLRHIGIDVNAPLSVLTIELFPPNNHVDFINMRFKAVHFQGLQSIDLDKIRILRTSRLCKITDTCTVS